MQIVSIYASSRNRLELDPGQGATMYPSGQTANFSSTIWFPNHVIRIWQIARTGSTLPHKCSHQELGRNYI